MRKYIVGMVFGILLSLSFSVYAEEIQSMIGKTVEGSFPLVIGDKRATKDVIIIEGTSYIPVRAAAEMFGYEVSFTADMGVGMKKKEKAVDDVTMLKEIKDILIKDGKIDASDEKAKEVYDMFRGEGQARNVTDKYYSWLKSQKAKEDNLKEIDAIKKKQEELDAKIKAEQDADDAERKRLLAEQAERDAIFQKVKEKDDQIAKEYAESRKK